MFPKAVNEQTRGVLAQVGACSFVNDFYLAGGTALALHLGHRESVDLDFFSQERFDGATLKKELSRFGEVWGVDNDEQALHFSAARAPHAHLAAGSLPDRLEALKDKQFDCITLFDVLEHIDDEAQSLQAIHTLLRPGGMLMLTVPAYQWLWTKYDDETHHKRRYTKKQLFDALQRSGFSIQKISYFNTLLFPAVAAIKLISAIGSLDASHPRIVPASPLNSILEKIFAIEAHMLPHINFPFGVSIVAIASKITRD